MPVWARRWLLAYSCGCWTSLWVPLSPRWLFPVYPDSSHLVVSTDMRRRFGSPVGMFSDVQQLGVYMRHSEDWRSNNSLHKWMSGASVGLLETHGSRLSMFRGSWVLTVTAPCCEHHWLFFAVGHTPWLTCAPVAAFWINCPTWPEPTKALVSRSFGGNPN